MASRFQACALVASPTYPNVIAWSDENLIAVATGHIVTILNPALPSGPRSLIIVPTPKTFQFGLIEKEDLSSPGMLPICLSRCTDRPSVRSISWSPIGMAPNAGCLLAVCTIEGQVKVYRSPYLEYQAEWLEVIDVAELLFDNLSRFCFEDTNTFNSDEYAPQPSQMHAPGDNLPLRISRKRVRNNDSEPPGGIMKFFKPVELSCSSRLEKTDDGNAGITPFSEVSVLNVSQTEIIQWHDSDENYPTKVVPRKSKKQVNAEKEKLVRESRLKSRNHKAQESPAGPSISAEEYISRNAMMASLIVAWSPLISSSSGVDVHNRFSLLAVGGKAGKISFWRVQEPYSYSVDNHDFSVTTIFGGFLHAHDSWITAINWVTLDVDLSNSQVVMVTGSAEGRVKIWFQQKSEFLLSEDGKVILNLATEIVTEDCSPVSTLSVAVAAKSMGKVLIALGKGSGSFEVWKCDLLLKIFDKIGTYNTHDHVVTGLAWAFGGRCLYSCSQDNYTRSWILRGDSLCETTFPSNTLGISSSRNIPSVSDSSFGIAVSPGNMAIAMARNLDTTLLDQMYQARCLKGTVEFFWIGGQEVELVRDTCFEINLDAYPEFSKKELLQWLVNMLSFWKHFEDSSKTLVVWDLVAALLAFKLSIPEYLEYFLVRWLVTIFPVPNVNCSLDEIFANASKGLQTCSCRQLQILNIICRQVILPEVKEEELKNKHLEISCDSERELLPMWIELLSNSERELRERIVVASLSTASVLKPCSSYSSSGTENCQPLGLSQMKQWIELHDQLVFNELTKSANNSHHNVPLEKCSFCSAPVAFESPEVANCQSECSNGKGEPSHKLERCAVSMQVCPNTPLWYCVCCRRRALTTAPPIFFLMSEHPVDLTTESSSSNASSKPLCPFCGVLQQRQLPAFLLSPTPV